MEIIAGVSLLVTIAIYVIIKKSKKSKKTEITQIDTFDTKDVTYDSFEDELDKPDEAISVDDSIKQKYNEEKAKQKEDSQFLNSVEERSFEVVEEPKVTQQEAQPPKTKRNKKEVAPHGKITKENFKEFAGMRILVAEDNLINQKVINGLLADSGIEIVMADDGQEALDILEKDNDFTLILMDAHMPRVDGFEATRAIRQNPQYDHILVVALSGDTAADDIKKMRNAGMEEQLEKPLKMDALYDIFAAYYNVSNDDILDHDDYISISITKELDGDKGLEVCGGDKEFYLEILNEFLTNYSNSAENLKKLLENAQIAKADKLLLDIVGLTANIGAINLNKIALSLKEAIHSASKDSYFAILNDYKKHLNRLLRDIKDFK
jgi:CheY-like chemotaxis protein